ncbi:hypothetical protein TSUD_166530 [Trifolium subterraneum]|uniref:F-box domain-containing protein n=1 Tax=Trifolium subterraneum TaxID=3900 RepID=A0A2Z6M1G8_TRISU|nr:hypothetical protein TSUD_166530 [Trifolium subterraneum]
MNIHMNLRSGQCHQKLVASSVFLPDELIAEVFSFLPVKSLIRLKCVSRSCNSLISEPTFIKLHLNQSSQKTDIILGSFYIDRYAGVSFTVLRMLENPSNIIPNFLKVPCHQQNHRERYVVGSCNGLLCLFGYSFGKECKAWFRIWNPATGTISEKLGYMEPCLGSPFNFAFGYDDSKNTFKVVNFLRGTTNVRVFSFGDNVWRNIQDSPLPHHKYITKAVHLTSSVNWLAIQNYFKSHYSCKDIAIEQFMIISLDLGTETHNKLLPPKGFNEVPFVEPNLSVLKDCLCFSHDYKHSHFVIWQMKEFGVEESWTQFLKISYHNLRIDYRSNDQSDFHLLPLCLLEKNHTLLLVNNDESLTILYNWIDNRAQKFNEPTWYDATLHYVESLVSYC